MTQGHIGQNAKSVKSHDDTGSGAAERETDGNHCCSTFLARLLLRLHSLLARVGRGEILALCTQLSLPGRHVCPVLRVQVSRWIEDGRSRGGSAPNRHLVLVSSLRPSHLLLAPVDALLLRDPRHLPHVHLLPQRVQQLVWLFWDRKVLAGHRRLPGKGGGGCKCAGEPVVWRYPPVRISPREGVRGGVHRAELGPGGGLGSEGGGDKLLLVLVVMLVPPRAGGTPHSWTTWPR